MSDEKNIIKITMSERAPIKIVKEDWPLIASANDHDGQVECQANREWAIRVREHEDGRRLVYGWVCRGNGGMPIGWRGANAGFLIEAGVHEAGDMAAETVRAIRRVAGVIENDPLGDECVADLPAEVI